jgi:hypothetical protein
MAFEAVEEVHNGDAADSLESAHAVVVIVPL